jgi:uncharacterized protein YlxW (UPF0749 family)
MTATDRTGRADRAGANSSSVALLVDLVTNTLDPGYAAAAKRAGDRSPRRRRLERVATAFGAVLAGFVLALAYVSTHRAAPETAKVHADLVSRVRSAQNSADQLDRTAQGLSNRVDSLRNAALSGSGSLRTQLQTAQLLAGATAAGGPGVQVTLADPPAPSTSAAAGRAGSTPISAIAPLTDRDVRSVVNELWAVGAEAISVNNIRLTPTSAIRFAGEAVLVDFEPINPPYVIRAIGNADQLDTGFASSDVASRYQTLAGVDGITFTFGEQSKLKLPAATVGPLTYARRAGPATIATPGPSGSGAPGSSPSETVSTGATK